MQLGAVDTHLLLRNDEGAFYMPTPHRLPRLLALAPAPTALSPTASAIEVLCLSYHRPDPFVLGRTSSTAFCLLHSQRMDTCAFSGTPTLTIHHVIPLPPPRVC